MRNFIISVFLGVLCLGSIKVYADGIGETNQARFDVEWAYGRAVGIDKSYGTAGVFLSPVNCYYDLCGFTQPFADLRGHYIVNGKWAANAGLGLRGFDAYRNRGWGASVYYDYRKGDLREFHQVGVSLESLGTLWDARLNGYLPVGRKMASHFRGGDDSDCGHRHRFDNRLHKERALKGFDAEIGAHVLRCIQHPFEPFDFYVAAGPYYYCDHFKKHGHDIWGAQVRAYLAFNDFVKFEVSASTDRMFHNRLQGVLTFEIPLDLNFSRERLPDYDHCLLLQPVHRNDMIVLREGYRH